MGLIDTIKSLFGAGAKQSREMMDDAREVAEKTASELSDKASDVARRARAEANEAVDRIGDAVADAREELSETMEELSAAAQDKAEELTETARQAAGTVAQKVSGFASNGNSTNAKTTEGKEPMGNTISMTVNGREVSGTCEDRTLLVQFIRENLGLTGTHVGCDTSQCGACVVHVDGKAVKSCTMLAAQAAGSEVTTVEGLSSGGELHPVQAAFKENHGLQCGFCTPGMIMTATDMIRRHGGKLDEATVRAELEGNICRCTGYHNIVKAILAAANEMGEGAKAAAE